jgi:hypothetical protein
LPRVFTGKKSNQGFKIVGGNTNKSGKLYQRRQ